MWSVVARPPAAEFNWQFKLQATNKDSSRVYWCPLLVKNFFAQMELVFSCVFCFIVRKVIYVCSFLLALKIVLSTHLVDEKTIKQTISPMNHSVSWVFLRYHKTGHEITNHIVRPFISKTCNASLVRIRDRSESKFTKEKYNANITLASAEQFLFPWKKTFSEHHLQNVKIIHFVRDPYDMIVSGFLYHSQTPVPEDWISSPNHNICVHNESSLMNVFVPKLAQSLNGPDISRNIDELRHNFTLLSKKCDTLQAKYSNLSFGEMLESAKHSNIASDGIFLEAIRSIFLRKGENCGDLLRMAMNAMYEDKRISKRVFTSQFPVGDKETFHNTTAAIFDFLMPEDEDDKRPSWQRCSSKERIVERVVTRGYVRKPPSRLKGETNRFRQHITVGFVNATTRANYKAMLASDPVIAPILNLVRNILLNVHN